MYGTNSIIFLDYLLKFVTYQQSNHGLAIQWDRIVIPYLKLDKNTSLGTS